MSVVYSLLCNNGQAAGSFFDLLSVEDKSRYGTAGAYRCYASLVDWVSDRGANTSAANVEILEIADAFVDAIAQTEISETTMPCYRKIITSTIRGVRSAAFHNGNIAAGYILQTVTWYSSILNIIGNAIIIDGINFNLVDTQTYAIRMRYAGSLLEIKNNIFHSASLASTIGIYSQMEVSVFYNNLAVGLDRGFDFGGYANKDLRAYNNSAINCGTGFIASSNIKTASFYNNLAFGCTTNWGAAPPAYALEGAGYNAGEPGDTPWDNGTVSTAVTSLVAADFVDFAGNDFRPATIASHQVDSAYPLYEAHSYDMIDIFRPNYSAGAGTDAWDIGCFEFDSGNGLEPVPITILVKCIDNITGLPVSGALVYIDDDDLPPRILDDVTDINGEASISYLDVAVPGAICRVRKYGYQPYRATLDIGTENITLPVTLIQAPQQT